MLQGCNFIGMESDMQVRTVDIYDRPTFQFINAVEKMIEEAGGILRSKKISGLKPVIQALDSLKRTIQDPAGKLGVKPALKAYEEARNKLLGTPDSLYREYLSALKKKKEAEDYYNHLPQQHEENLNKQKRLRNAVVEDMSLEELRELGITAKENQRLIINYEDLDLKLNIKRNELKKLEAKIQRNCCGGALCNKEDIARARNINHEINVLINLQASIKENPIRAERSKDEVNELKGKLAQVRKEIEDLIDGYESKRKKARRKVDDAAKRISDVNKKIDGQQLDQCRTVDRDTMFNLVHLRARVSGFYRLVEKVYGEDQAARPILDMITSAKLNWSDKLNSMLGSIYYPIIEGKNGFKLYSAYREWAKLNSKEKDVIESAEYSPNEYINNVVPEIKSEDANALHHSTLGTVHDFFPRVDRSSASAAASTPSVSNSLSV